MSFDAILSLARHWGFSGVELRAADGHIEIARALKERYATPAGMVKALAGSPVRIASLDASLQLLAPSEAHKAEVLELAHWADALGVPYIRVFDGKLEAQMSTAAGIEAVLRTLEWWHALRRRHGFHCDLMIETHWLLTDPDLCLRLAAEASAPVHLLWDSFHTWRASKLSVSEVWQRLRPHVRHIHFKDAKIAPASAHGICYCLPGEGDFPLQDLFSSLAADSFSGWVSFEWERLWHPDIPPLESALAQGRALKWW